MSAATRIHAECMMGRVGGMVVYYGAGVCPMCGREAPERTPSEWEQRTLTADANRLS